MESKPTLTIVIPTFNRKAQLSALLGQLKNQKVESAEVNTVVVVDGSTDGTFEFLRLEYPKVRIVAGDGNWWFTRSMSEGCKYAVETLNTELILMLNDDVHLPDNYVEKMLHSFNQTDKNAVIASSSYSLTEPRMITFSGYKSENKLLLKKYRYLPPFTKMEPGKLKGLAESVTLPTRGLIMSGSLLKKINYLDYKTFPQYASDYDMVLRAGKAGAKIFVTYDAHIFEDMNLTSNGNPRLTKSLMHYLRNTFFNKYSANYFYNGLHMAWRFGYKPLFPFYFLNSLVSVFYVYAKYKFFLNKKIQEKVIISAT
jgi:GT2 family glycosyltransferase